MKQQVYEEALKRIAFESAPEPIERLGEQHPNGVRPLDLQEQVDALKGALRVIHRTAQEALNGSA